MKRFISFLPILIYLSSKSQISEKIQLPKTIKIGTISNVMMNTFVDLDYYVKATDTTYLLTFANKNYSAITDMQSVSFKELGGTLASLYKILNEKFGKEDVDGESFKLGGKDVIIKSTKKYVSFTLLDTGAWFSLTKKQLDQLFGKR